MALVFKIKHGDTLRRWVVSESLNAETFPVTLDQLYAKVRELFQFPPAAVLSITYLDKENDTVTLGEDHDLVDAFLVQLLNPLKLEVQVLESKSSGTDRSNQVANDMNSEEFLKRLFPGATAEALQTFLQRYGQEFDTSLPIGTLILKAQDAFNELMTHASRSDLSKPGPSDKPAHHPHHHQHRHHHPYKHPFGDARSKFMPNAENQASPKDWSGFPSYHLGVQCDGCGVTPIQGLRYTSNKVPDYDLCSSCYQEKGKEEDYDKVENPVFPWSFHGRHYQPPCLRKGFKQFMGGQCMGPPMGRRGFFARGPYGWRPDSDAGHNEHKKLDARFLKDVTIFDGTEVAPGTKFTKIWRMSNNGSLSWPQNTQLLHIGGDVLCLQEAVNLELPKDGLACGEEVEVSVDLTAPEKAGRYISHWRLASPTGQNFGQRVWVTVQVVPQGEQSPMLQESLKDGGEETLIVQEPPKERNNIFVPATANQSLIDVPIVSKDEAVKEPTSDTDVKNQNMIENGSVLPHTDGLRDAKVAVMYPDISQELEGFSIVEKPLVEFDDDEMMDIANNGNPDKENEELKLQSLESMGFMDRELNVVLLNNNNGNVQLTVDQLLVAAGYDGTLEDLQEMGFNDRVTNVKLLMKHDGDLKAAVRELVRMGKHKHKA